MSSEFSLSFNSFMQLKTLKDHTKHLAPFADSAKILNPYSPK